MLHDKTPLKLGDEGVGRENEVFMIIQRFDHPLFATGSASGRRRIQLLSDAAALLERAERDAIGVDDEGFARLAKSFAASHKLEHLFLRINVNQQHSGHIAVPPASCK